MKITAEGNDESVIETMLIRETEEAILIEGVDGDEVWLPLSQIEILEIKDCVCEVAVPNWLMTAKELV